MIDRIIASYMASRQDRTQSTLKGYYTACKPFTAFLVDGEITREVMAAYAAHLASRYTVATQQRYWRMACAIASHGQKMGLVSPQALDGLRGPNHTQSKEPKREALEVGQVREVLEKIDTSTETGQRDKAMIALMAICGLRDVEVSRAETSDLEQIGGVYRLYVQGKGHTSKDDFVVLPADVALMLLDYWDGRKIASTALVSNSRTGTPLTPQTISKTVKARLRAAGYDSRRLTAHSLRHTAITIALEQGASLEDVAAMARHTDTRVTRRYDHSRRATTAKIATASLNAAAILG